VLDRLILPVRIHAQGLWNPDPHPRNDDRWLVDHRLFEDAVTVDMDTVRPLRPGEAIHYTINGSVPTAESPVYRQPLTLTQQDCAKRGEHEQTVVVQGRLFRKGDPVGYAARQEYRYDSVAALPKAVRYTLYEAPDDMQMLTEDVQSLKVIQTGVVPWMDLRELPRVPFPERGTRYAMVFEGRIDVPQDGDYTLQLRSQGGRSRLFIDGDLAVDRGKTDWGQTEDRKQLTAGPHTIKLIYVGGGRFMTLRYSLGDAKKLEAFELIPLDEVSQ
jgi:hypothetical protein